ncbi:hypothetical protein Poli38472_009447 [Pythium oligandrum]|uniref:Cwf19-like C-terminal domain-containing protein n=1 Tax=Pythium oligandrum TaxID=41045 RepID=A0A8K1CF86_PYTOL|nr:hypothetical protein Poli38472_009447 [Pythium oligandrum]|eukprot:TMW61954.1 hypothetical protein Poli38472_009447 [Pythium oligandrum]
MTKVLLCGQVDGHWSLVWERVRKLNAAAKGAPFEALVCVGRVFPFPVEYVQEAAQVPVPTYFIPAFEDASQWENDAAQRAIYDKMQVADVGAPVEVFKNCFYLGNQGVSKIAGLSVAFIAGADSNDPFGFSTKEVRALEETIKAQSDDVDFFFSAQYASHFDNLLADQQVPGELKTIQTATALDELLVTFAPRYHITSSSREADKGVFYQRLPYVTEHERSGRKQITRLIGLCGVSSSKDKTKKYLHALQVTPSASQIDAEKQQSDIPPGTTQNPYKQHAVQLAEPALKRQRVSGPPPPPPRSGLSAEQVAQLTAQSGQGAQFFYDQQIAARGQRPDALRHPQRNRPPVPERTECWFCLATPSVERHLIVSIGQEAYLAMPKGAINEDHVLIVPIAHEASTSKLSDGCMKEIARFKEGLRKYFDSQDKDMVLFDRNILTVGATHCHLQVVGIPRTHAASAHQVFLDEGEKYNVKFQELKADDDLYALTEGKPYFYVEIPDGQGKTVRLLNFVEAKQYMQFGRHAAACVLGVPRRANWKYCVVPKHEEEAMTKAFKSKWQPFDFTLEYDE